MITILARAWEVGTRVGVSSVVKHEFFGRLKEIIDKLF
jgi:hypothetical protein